MATASITQAQAKIALDKINGNMGSAFWDRRVITEANAKKCLERLTEVHGRTKTIDLTGSDGDVYNAL
jgi:hypothetical protein